MLSAGSSDDQELGSCLQAEFVNGIEALDNVVNVLSTTDISCLTGTVKNREQIKLLSSSIRQAHQHLTTALELCQSDINNINSEIENKVQEIRRTQQDLSSKQQQCAALNEKLQSINEQISSNEEQLDEAQGSLKRAEEREREQKKKLHKAKKKKKFGIVGGLLAAPVVGVVAGIGIAAGGSVVLGGPVKAAKNNLESARNDVHSCHERLSSKINEKQNLEGQLERENREKSNAEAELDTTTAELQQLEKERDSKVAVQQKLRETCHFMSEIWGKSNVLVVESANMYSLEPLFAPLVEISDMLSLDAQSKSRVRALLSNDIGICAGMASKMKAISENLAESELDLV